MFVDTINIQKYICAQRVITVLRPHSLCRTSRPSFLLTPDWMKQSAESHWELQFSSDSMTDQFHTNNLRDTQTTP